MRIADSSLLERASKALVLASLLGALVLQLWYAKGEWPSLPLLALAGAIAAYLFGRRWPERTAALVLAAGYLTPVASFLAARGVYYWNFAAWAALFLGAAAATSSFSWNYPSRLRVPLISWALIVAVTWPIVAVRELDWVPSVLWTSTRIGKDAVHAIPTTISIAYAAEAHLLGLLWIDWLFGRFTGKSFVKFQQLIMPLLVAAAVGGALAAYQGLVDLHFLSVSIWPPLGRASGALGDANASGALGALWVAIPLAMAVAAPTTMRSTLLALTAVVLFAAVWMTGSRTALLIVVVSFGALGHLLVRSGIRRSRVMIAALLLVATTAVMVLVVPSTGVGPIRRIQAMFPSLSATAIRGVASELWTRSGYGPAADAMIKDAPLVGVGVGMYQYLTVPYSRILTVPEGLPSDNAQNWFRHQLAELGVIGSLGCFWWSALLLMAIFGRGGDLGRDPLAIVLKYAVAGFGFASLLGVPSQNLFVTLTAWTLMFGLLLSRGVDDRPITANVRTIVWPLVVAITVGAITTYEGWRDLRPPFRAKRLDYAYQYGVYNPVEGGQGRTQTDAHAVVVPAALTRMLKLTVWVEHPDADQRAVPVEVWVNRKRIVRSNFPRNVPLMRLVPLPDTDRRFVLETKVGRTFVAPSGQNVGLNVMWEFQSSP